MSEIKKIKIPTSCDLSFSAIKWAFDILSQHKEDFKYDYVCLYVSEHENINLCKQLMEEFNFEALEVMDEYFDSEWHIRFYKKRRDKLFDDYVEIWSEGIE